MMKFLLAICLFLIAPLVYADNTDSFTSKLKIDSSCPTDGSLYAFSIKYLSETGGTKNLEINSNDINLGQVWTPATDEDITLIYEKDTSSAANLEVLEGGPEHNGQPTYASIGNYQLNGHPQDLVTLSNDNYQYLDIYNNNCYQLNLVSNNSDEMIECKQISSIHDYACSSNRFSIRKA